MAFEEPHPTTEALHAIRGRGGVGDGVFFTFAHLGHGPPCGDCENHRREIAEIMKCEAGDKRTGMLAALKQSHYVHLSNYKEPIFLVAVRPDGRYDEGVHDVTPLLGKHMYGKGANGFVFSLGNDMLTELVVKFRKGDLKACALGEAPEPKEYHPLSVEGFAYIAVRQLWLEKARCSGDNTTFPLPKFAFPTCIGWRKHASGAVVLQNIAAAKGDSKLSVGQGRIVSQCMQKCNKVDLNNLVEDIIERFQSGSGDGRALSPKQKETAYGILDYLQIAVDNTLSALHQLEINHGDVKPCNFGFRNNDPDLLQRITALVDDDHSKAHPLSDKLETLFSKLEMTLFDYGCMQRVSPEMARHRNRKMAGYNCPVMHDDWMSSMQKATGDINDARLRESKSIGTRADLFSALVLKLWFLVGPDTGCTFGRIAGNLLRFYDETEDDSLHWHLNFLKFMTTEVQSFEDRFGCDGSSVAVSLRHRAERLIYETRAFVEDLDARMQGPPQKRPKITEGA